MRAVVNTANKKVSASNSDLSNWSGVEVGATIATLQRMVSTMSLLASADSFSSLFVDSNNYDIRITVSIHIVLVYPHIFLLASSLFGHDAETKYVGRECADKVHDLLG